MGDKAVQGNVDPAVLFAAPEAVEHAVREVAAAGPRDTAQPRPRRSRGTPEENVKVFFDTAKEIKY